MKHVNLGSEEAPKWYFVATILVNGEELEIIPAFTDYSIRRKCLEKNKTDQRKNLRDFHFMHII